MLFKQSTTSSEPLANGDKLQTKCTFLIKNEQKFLKSGRDKRAVLFDVLYINSFHGENKSATPLSKMSICECTQLVTV